jgi:hypothetical protein
MPRRPTAGAGASGSMHADNSDIVSVNPVLNRRLTAYLAKRKRPYFTYLMSNQGFDTPSLACRVVNQLQILNAIALPPLLTYRVGRGKVVEWVKRHSNSSEDADAVEPSTELFRWAP